MSSGYSSLLELCERLFATRNLYELLSVAVNSTQSDVKRGYHRLSLKVHPDRVSEDEKAEATVKFQVLGRVYSILSDPERRATYDETGAVDDTDTVETDRDWSEYWRLLFSKVTVQDITEFETKYRGSAEEIDDVSRAYVDHCGDMGAIIDAVMCATVDDQERFMAILSPLVEDGRLPRFECFSRESKRKQSARRKRATKEASEAEAVMEELGLRGDNSLKNIIQQRQQSRENKMEDFFSQLEAKYAKPKRACKPVKTSKKSQNNKNKS